MGEEDKKGLYITLFISILLHLVGLALISGFDLLAFSSKDAPENIQPLELVFDQPEPLAGVPADAPAGILQNYDEAIPQKFYEIVENPNASGEQPENADMLSTMASRSQAPVIIPGLQPHFVPGSEDGSDTRTAGSMEKAEPEGQEPETAEELPAEPDGSMLAFQENPLFSRSALSGKKEQNKPGQNGAGGENRKGSGSGPAGFDADMVGDFALSTYEWEWAPYWLAFQRKLNRVWYAPPAYYELGLIYGYTIVRFKVSRNGNLSDLAVLQQVGHSSLQSSSVSAIEAVFPFQPLPENFPDPYLEVTIKMIYPNLREYNASQTRP